MPAKKIMTKCPHCPKRFSAREFRTHVPKCRDEKKMDKCAKLVIDTFAKIGIEVTEVDGAHLPKCPKRKVGR